MNHKKLSKAIQFRTKKQYKKAEILFLELLQVHEKEAIINYHYAWLLDNLGKEKEAILFYETALENGLDKEFRQDCFLGLGSTYRMLKNYPKSLFILEKALKEFPEAEDLIVFKAMKLIASNESKEAAILLLDLMIKAKNLKSIQLYTQAIQNFTQKASY